MQIGRFQRWAIRSWNGMPICRRWLAGARRWRNSNWSRLMRAWAFGELGLRNYWAFPVDHSSNVLYQIAPRFGPFVRHYFEGEPMGSLVYATNTSELHWMDLPLLAPVLRSVTTERRDYLLLSLAPLPLRIKVPPPDLFAQLKDRNDLLYYDWEITEHRLQEWKRLYQRIDMSHLRLMG